MVPLLGYLSILLTILPNFSFTAKKKKKKNAPVTGRREQLVAGVLCPLIPCATSLTLWRISGHSKPVIFFLPLTCPVELSLSTSCSTHSWLGP